MKLFKALFALLFAATLLAGCDNTEEADPAMDAAPTAAEPAAPAEEAAPADAAPAESASEEPGGWVPPPEGS